MVNDGENMTQIGMSTFKALPIMLGGIILAGSEAANGGNITIGTLCYMDIETMAYGLLDIHVLSIF